ncbi:hypothetical protein EG328_002663 [Venturia inaequalis]|uniref:Uncharacterized protein n=1 Tax=Venturia inaequalis TaxID=5025 RepID=A0A8H3ZBH3_VENIN|nr:hypothetical protein EG328_002663 [Venturia inaequalis]KAE9992889.1 hypothetical protein EG327_007366 [Venturia inaequalis]RDI85046.1 hypothetical protein Vi05172_g4964 [Venturia inaequalis]
MIRTYGHATFPTRQQRQEHRTPLQGSSGLCSFIRPRATALKRMEFGFIFTIEAVFPLANANSDCLAPGPSFYLDTRASYSEVPASPYYFHMSKSGQTLANS